MISLRGDTLSQQRTSQNCPDANNPEYITRKSELALLTLFQSIGIVKHLSQGRFNIGSLTYKSFTSRQEMIACQLKFVQLIRGLV